MLDKLTQEDIEFLQNLAHELHTQDQCGTATPYWSIRQTKKTPCPAGYEDGYVLYDNMTGESFYDLEEAKAYMFEELDDGSMSSFPEAKLPDAMREIESIKEWLDIEYFIENYCVDYLQILCYQNVEYDTNAFLTSKACKEHLERTRHNCKQPIVYANSFDGNREMIKLVNILKKFGKSEDN